MDDCSLWNSWMTDEGWCALELFCNVFMGVSPLPRRQNNLRTAWPRAQPRTPVFGFLLARTTPLLERPSSFPPNHPPAPLEHPTRLCTRTGVEAEPNPPGSLLLFPDGNLWDVPYSMNTRLGTAESVGTRKNVWFLRFKLKSPLEQTT